MSKVQVIGLPGAGKTSTIKRFLKENPNLIVSYLDIRNFSGTYKQTAFAQALYNTDKSFIAESACGVPISDNIIIQFAPPISIVYDRLRSRGDIVDPDYLSLLASKQALPHYIIKTSDDLIRLLKQLFTEAGTSTHANHTGEIRRR